MNIYVTDNKGVDYNFLINEASLRHQFTTSDGDWEVYWEVEQATFYNEEGEEIVINWLPPDEDALDILFSCWDNNDCVGDLVDKIDDAIKEQLLKGEE